MVRKKLLLGIMSVVTATSVLLSGSFATATSTASDQPTGSCSQCQQHPDMTKEKAIQLLAEKGVIVNESPAKQDTKVAEKAMNDIMKGKEVSQNLKDADYKKVKGSEAFYSFENIELGGYQYDKVVVISGMMNNSQNKVINYTAWVDVVNNEAVKYFVGEVGQESAVTYVTYEKSMPNTDGEFSTAGFTTDWGSFQCSLAGWLLCAHYCGIWALVNPIAGGACGAACTLAMAWVCAVSYS